MKQTILITGASMGIGESVAHEFARLGAELILVARSEAKLQDLCKNLQATSPGVSYFTADLSKPDQVTALGDKLALLPQLDGIIHNAGIGLYGPFESVENADIRELFEINFFSILNLTRRLLPLLRKSAQPKILMVSSVVSWRAIPLLSAYSASKSALNGFAEALRVELAPYGIRVVNVYPGRTRTGFSANAKSTGWLPFSTDRRGMRVERLAKKLVRAYFRGKRDEYVSWSNRCLIWGNFLFPKLLDWGLKKYFREK